MKSSRQWNFNKLSSNSTFYSMLLVGFLLLATAAVCFTARNTFHVKAAKPQVPLHILSIPYYSIKGDWDSVLTIVDPKIKTEKLGRDQWVPFISISS